MWELYLSLCGQSTNRALGVILLLADKGMNTNEVGGVFILSYGFEKGTLMPCKNTVLKVMLPA